MKERQSNLELLRIVAMLAVIAGHFLWQSGLVDAGLASGFSPKTLFLQFASVWGKTAINAFVLISGYFMCTGRLTPRRFVRLVLEVYFYKFFTLFVARAIGWAPLSGWCLFRAICWPFYEVNHGFTTSFIWFYLFIPFYNTLLLQVTKRQLGLLIAALVAMMTVSSSFFLNPASFNYVLWYMTMYFIGAFVRLYPYKWMNSNCVCVPALILAFIGSCALIIGLNFAPAVGAWKFGFDHLLLQSDRPCALGVGILLFLSFKNWRLRYSRFINAVAATCFGVLLIHGAYPHEFTIHVWDGLFHGKDWYGHSFVVLAAVSISVPLIVFSVCSVCDFIRIHLIEKPFLDYLERHVFDPRLKEWWSGRS